MEKLSRITFDPAVMSGNVKNRGVGSSYRPILCRSPILGGRYFFILGCEIGTPSDRSRSASERIQTFIAYCEVSVQF